MKAVLKNIVELVATSFKEWNEDRASRLSAALAYYTVFSISPLLIIALAIAGQFFDQNAVRNELMAQIGGLLGPQGAEIVGTMLENAARPADSLIASLIGVVTLLLGASGVFGELQSALNTIWEVTPNPERGLLSTVKTRFLPFTMVLSVGFLLLVSLIVSTVLSALNTFLSGDAESVSWVLQAFNVVLSFGAITLIFALIFKFVPDVQIAWRDVWLGAAVTSLLFVIGKFVIGFYLGNSSVTSTYGAAGSLVIILLWVYYSTQILFLGAEFTQVYANKYGSLVRPARGAVPLTEKTRVQEGIPHEEEVQRSKKVSERAEH
jgi:membrane protein